MRTAASAGTTVARVSYLLPMPSENASQPSVLTFKAASDASRTVWTFATVVTVAIVT